MGGVRERCRRDRLFGDGQGLVLPRGVHQHPGQADERVGLAGCDREHRVVARDRFVVALFAFVHAAHARVRQRQVRARRDDALLQQHGALRLEFLEREGDPVAHDRRDLGQSSSTTRANADVHPAPAPAGGRACAVLAVEQGPGDRRRAVDRIAQRGLGVAVRLRVAAVVREGEPAHAAHVAGQGGLRRCRRHGRPGRRRVRVCDRRITDEAEQLLPQVFVLAREPLARRPGLVAATEPFEGEHEPHRRLRQRRQQHVRGAEAFDREPRAAFARAPGNHPRATPRPRRGVRARRRRRCAVAARPGSRRARTATARPRRASPRPSRAAARGARSGAAACRRQDAAR